MIKLITFSFSFFLIAVAAISQTASVEFRKSVSQYGITWEFDHPVTSGQFVTGDWWVVGPVTIVKITPEPGPVSVDQSAIRINHWNDTSLKTDTAMRNGSVIVQKAGYKQSYDSRAGAFDPSGCIKLPLKLNLVDHLFLPSAIHHFRSIISAKAFFGRANTNAKQ